MGNREHGSVAPLVVMALFLICFDVSADEDAFNVEFDVIGEDVLFVQKTKLRLKRECYRQLDECAEFKGHERAECMEILNELPGCKLLFAPPEPTSIVATSASSKSVAPIREPAASGRAAKVESSKSVSPSGQ